MIRIKLDVTKIDKSRLLKGWKGTYLDVTLIETPDSKWGHDYMAVQDIGKEAREAGEKGPILGNAKRFDSVPSRQAARATPPPQPQMAANRTETSEEVPF